MTTTTDATRTDLAAGLHDLADYLAARPDVPINFEQAEIVYHVGGRDGDHAGLTELAAIAAMLGVQVTDSSGGPVAATTTHYCARRRFGPVTYRALYISRAEMADHEARMSYHDSIRADRPEVTA